MDCWREREKVVGGTRRITVVERERRTVGKRGEGPLDAGKE